MGKIIVHQEKIDNHEELTELCPFVRMPNRAMSPAEDLSRSQTSGAATRANIAIGRAMISEIGTAARKASCLGTNSPTTRLK